MAATAILAFGVGITRFSMVTIPLGTAVSCDEASAPDGGAKCRTDLFITISGAAERPGEGRIRFPGYVQLGGIRAPILVEAGDVPWSALAHPDSGDQLYASMEVSLFTAVSNPFSYQAFLQRRGFGGTAKVREVNEYLARPRAAGTHDLFIDRLVNTFGPTPELAVCLAGAIGEKDLLDEETKRVFKNTGLTHLLVVSGYQVGMLFGLAYTTARSTLSRCTKLLLVVPVQSVSAVLAFTVSGAYTLLIGGVLTTVRALLALAIVACGRLIARRSDPWRSLLLVLCCSQVIWPGSIFEAGCELTFAALVGLIVAGGWSAVIRHCFAERPFTSFALQTLALSLGPALFTTPVVLLWFRVFVPLAVLYNAVCVSLFSLLFSCLSGATLLVLYLRLPGAEWAMSATLRIGKAALDALEVVERAVRATALRPIELGAETSVMVALGLGVFGAMALRSDPLRKSLHAARMGAFSP
ncbi:MAG: ComEC/Rec2 family competence protein [Bdellovibrionota bacterium]